MSTEQSTKLCRKCGEMKPFGDYHKDKNRRDGICPHCKACEKRRYEARREQILEQKREYHERNRERLNANARHYRAENPEKIAAVNRRWAAENAERKAEYNRKYRQQNREYFAAYEREYYLENRERITEQARRYYEENKEHLLSLGRRHYEENRERYAQLHREWKQSNHDKLKAYRAVESARERNAEGYFTAQDVLDMYESQGGLCAYCEGSLYGVYHVDHMLPLVRGGSHWPENLAVTCPTCNLRKNSKTTEEFMAVIG